jgi:WD40 repeat protein
MDSTDAP